MAEELEKLLWSKATWLADFEGGKAKRPDWEIEIRRHEHAVLKQAAADYRRAIERRSA
ncbi:hypothetical protein [Mesorhizobium sp. IMUNJ 23232]|uniref:hypothetical protein n=1 Tax=Mesorhizobium sp. IMUNJ 23232 TaxID=3376064 RepID=UPI0037A50108